MTEDARPPPAESGVELQMVEPKLFGTIPSRVLLVGGAVGVPISVALLATTHWVLGSLLIVVALAALALEFVAARHRPRGRTAEKVVGRLWLARDEVRFAGTSVRAWVAASACIVAMRRRSRGINHERDRVQRELGAAAYEQDAARVDELRRRMFELDEAIGGCRRRMEAARRVARARVSRARRPVLTTQVVAPKARRPEPTARS
jgi:hypothetical protein